MVCDDSMLKIPRFYPLARFQTKEKTMESRFDMAEARNLLDSPNLLSLDEIIRKVGKAESQPKSLDQLESYLMFTAEDMSKQVDQEVNPKTIIVNHMSLYLNDEPSVVISFTDISTYQRLKHEEEVNNLLKTLNASVHHEMLVPLKVNVEMA